MSHTPLSRRWIGAMAALLTIGLLAGCSDDEPPTDADSAKDTPSAPATTATDPATDPNSPFVVAASAVATRSLDQVTQLHVMGVGTVGETELPRRQIPGLARAIRDELGQQVADATMMTPPRNSAAARLVAALTAYKSLAADLSGWKSASGRPMTDAWFAELRRTDKAWKAALVELGELSGQDLLANLPPLMLPT